MLIKNVFDLLKYIFALGFLIIQGTVLFAQNQPVDTVDVIERLVNRNDTTVRQGKGISITQAFDSLLFKNSNSRLKKELYNLIMKGGSDTVKKSPSSNVELAAVDGKLIRHLKFRNLDLFAPSITDTLYNSENWLGKTANLVHNDTRRMILKRYLLFDTGDILDVFEIAENERILRDLPFIMDARFVPLRVKGTRDSVDMLLLTQDKLPVGLEFNIINSEIVLGASYQNVLGFGHQLMLTSFWDPRHTPLAGYSISYGTSNIARTFISGKISYISKWNQESYMLDFSRNFRTLSFKNAGGISYEKSSVTRNIEFLDTTLYDVNLYYSNVDFWLGRVFPINYNTPTMRSGIFIAGRINQYENLQHPNANEAMLFSYRDRSMAMISSGMTKQGFRKDNMIYTYGRTEDVPYGYLVDLTAGYEWDLSQGRPYVSAGASYGAYFKNSSYIYGQVRFGTFLNKGPEQGAVRFQLKYFSALFHSSRFQYRNFANLTFIHGINRIRGEYTTLSNQGGISGLSSPLMKGKDKVVLNLESVIFSPYVLLGFRLAFFGGVDFGVVSREGSSFVDTRAFTALSAGIRMRNERLVFDTFVIKFSLYPGKPMDATGSNFLLGSLPRARFNDFFPGKPDVLSY